MDMDWLEEVLLCRELGGVFISTTDEPLSVSLLLGLSAVAAEDTSDTFSELLKVELRADGDDCWDTLSLVDTFVGIFSTITEHEGLHSTISISIRSASGTANKLPLFTSCPNVGREFLGDEGMTTVFALESRRLSIGVARGVERMLG